MLISSIRHVHPASSTGSLETLLSWTLVARNPHRAANPLTSAADLWHPFTQEYTRRSSEWCEALIGDGLDEM